MDSYSRTSDHSVIERGYGVLSDSTSPPIRFTQPAPRSAVLRNTLNGYRNPFWRDQVRNLQNATTPLTAVQYSVPPTYLSVGFDWSLVNHVNPGLNRTVHQEWSGYLAPPLLYGWPGSPDTSLVNHVRNTALSKLLSKIDSIRSSFESGQDFGEIEQTLHSIRRPFNSFRLKTVSYLESLLKAKSRYRRHIPSLKKVLADSYLEWHFGVSPLLGDIASAYADYQRQRYPVYPFSVSSESRYNGSAGPLFFTPNGYSVLLGRIETRYNSYGTYSVRFKGMCKSGADPSGQISLAQDWQLVPSKFLPTAWDLLPWSWMADFFTNVGDIIRGLSFVSGNLCWIEETHHQEETVNFNVIGIDMPSTGLLLKSSASSTVRYNQTGNGASGKYTRTTISRSIPSSLFDFVPSVELRVPHTPFQIADTAAALFSRYEKLLPFF